MFVVRTVVNPLFENCVREPSMCGFAYKIEKNSKGAVFAESENVEIRSEKDRVRRTFLSAEDEAFEDMMNHICGLYSEGDEE